MSMAADLISYVPQPNTSLAVSFLELLNNQSVFQNVIVRTEVRYKSMSTVLYSQIFFTYYSRGQ